VKETTRFHGDDPETLRNRARGRPTGSGKTTTLHAALHFINKPETKIWTAEDPWKSPRKDFARCRFNRRSGLTLRRHEVFPQGRPGRDHGGEMRDHETVSTGIEASLTGHLVFSTLHTNSAPEQSPGFWTWNGSFNFADALLGVLASVW